MLSHFKTKQFDSWESELLPLLNMKMLQALCVWCTGDRESAVSTVLCHFYVRDLTFPGLLP